jgi:hypothetical protein
MREKLLNEQQASKKSHACLFCGDQKGSPLSSSHIASGASHITSHQFSSTMATLLLD